MLVKALIAKKLLVTAALIASGVMDAHQTNWAARQARFREYDPVVRPFVRTPGVYVVTQLDVAPAVALVWLRPKWRPTKWYAGYVFSEHTSLAVWDSYIKSPRQRCWRIGPNGSGEACN